MTSLESLVGDADIIVTAGSGGVGKTTTAAVLALQGARAGRRAVVVTIDPAKRLADALGLDGLTNEPTKIDGLWAGELWAMMLDTKSTFDDLVARYAADPSQAERILGNRFYRNISGALSGTQEYMAMEKLYELHVEHDFDLVVVDTPPSRHALDFLDAPRRLTKFLNNRVLRTVMLPTRGVLRAANVAAVAVVRSLSKVVGAEVVDDAVTFFAAFSGMEEGFKHRANAVFDVLASPRSAFVLVASPRRDAVDEADHFASRLLEAGISVRALIVNRMHPRFGDGLAEAAHDRERTSDSKLLRALYANVADFRVVASREDEHLAGLAARLAPAPVSLVPLLRSDVHDLDGLTLVGEHLFGSGTADRGEA